MISRVIAPRCWIMREPSKSSAQETELLFGHTFQADRQEKSWVFGQALSPLGQEVQGYKGWIKAKHLAQSGAARSHYISALKAPIFHGPDLKSRVLELLHMGAQLSAKPAGGNFYALESGGYVHQRHLLPLGKYSTTDFVEAAARYAGLPYIWGGISSDGLDCSGLVQSSLRAIGRDCMRDAGQQEQSLGQALGSAETFQRGDLVFWAGHVGIMRDSQILLHANAFHMTVAEEPLTTAIDRIGPPSCVKRL